MTIRFGFVLPIMLVVAPVAASAQQRPPAAFPDSVKTVVPETQTQGFEMKPEEQAGTSGYFLGIISMLIGGTVGSNVGQANCPARTVDKDCMSRHAFTGALIAGSAMIPLGVHLATPHRHNLLKTMAFSAVTGAALYYGAKAVPGEPIGLAAFVAAPIQVITSVRLERQKTKTEQP